MQVSYKDVDLHRVFERPESSDNLSTKQFRTAMAKATSAVWSAGLPTEGDRIEALVLSAAKMFHLGGYSQEDAIDHVTDTLRNFYRSHATQ